MTPSARAEMGTTQYAKIRLLGSIDAWQPQPLVQNEGEFMSRFEERSLQLIDLVDRFESVPPSTHTRNALAIIERLNEEGQKLWKQDGHQYAKWKGYCEELSQLLKGLDQRRHRESQGLETALREFIHEFEHSTFRMRQLAYGVVGDVGSKRDEIAGDTDKPLSMSEILDWFNLVYRLSTYALTSAWTDDEQGSTRVEIQVDMKTGQVREKRTVIERIIPAKYRKFAKRLR